MSKIAEMEIGGRVLSFETGRMAKQANGSVLARYGDTVVLVTSVMSEKPREGLDFFPLLVDYEERFYSAGKIPGGFIKREGRPSETAILSGRMVDRSIRSLFPEHMRNDVHVVATVLSVDQQNSPQCARHKCRIRSPLNIGHPLGWPHRGGPDRVYRWRAGGKPHGVTDER